MIKSPKNKLLMNKTNLKLNKIVNAGISITLLTAISLNCEFTTPL